MLVGRPNKKTWAILGILLAVAGIFSIWLLWQISPGSADLAAGKESKRARAEIPATSSTLGRRQTVAPNNPAAEPPTQTGSKASFFKALAQYGAENGRAAVPFLKGYLDHPDWEFRCAAIRALAETGSEEVMALLQDYVSDGRGLEEAAQATLSLGDFPDPRATGFLTQKYPTVKNAELKACLLDTLAARPYEETRGFFQAQLNSPEVDLEIKAAALRSLGFHRTAPTEMLMPFLASSDTEVRTAAYDALASRPGEAHGRMLAAHLATETDSDARKSLYNALSAQTDLLPAELQNLVRAENNTASRIRADKAWAAALARNADAMSVRQFAESAIPELTQQALSNPDPGEQRAALQALAASRTQAAAQALADISAKSQSPRLRAIAAELSRATRPTTTRN